MWMSWVTKSANGLLTSGIPETRTPGFWNNVSQCCGSAGVAQFFLDLHGATHERRYITFAQTMTADLMSRATRDDRGMRWVQAEHRVRPELLIAQTGTCRALPESACGCSAWTQPSTDVPRSSAFPTRPGRSHDRRGDRSAMAVRVHDHVPLPVPSPHDGTGALIAVLKTIELRDRRRRRTARRRGSGPASSRSSSRPASSPASRWSSSSAPTGRGSPATPARSSVRRSSMEGVFAFFAESSFLGVLPVRRAPRRPARALAGRGHGRAPARWLSGFFIVATNAWMQHPVGYRRERGPRRAHQPAGRC